MKENVRVRIGIVTARVLEESLFVLPNLTGVSFNCSFIILDNRALITTFSFVAEWPYLAHFIFAIKYFIPVLFASPHLPNKKVFLLLMKSICVMTLLNSYNFDCKSFHLRSFLSSHGCEQSERYICHWILTLLIESSLRVIINRSLTGYRVTGKHAGMEKDGARHQHAGCPKSQQKRDSISRSMKIVILDRNLYGATCTPTNSLSRIFLGL